jgi:excisionase family DNA binding protein
MTLIEKLKSMNNALTVTELAGMLHMGKTAIYDMVRREAIPCIRFGYSVRFDPQEIADWLQQRCVFSRNKTARELPIAPGSAGKGKILRF